MSIEQKQRLYLAVTMVLVALSVGAISLYFSYQSAFSEKRFELINIAKSRARVIEAVARFDLEQSSDFPEGHVEATLSQFREAHLKFEGFGSTGEYTLAKKEDDQIVFLLRHRHSTATATETTTTTETTTPFNSSFAEPMRRALQGKSGVVIGLDYRGKTVLAAYEPVAVLNLGLVAKIDLTEIKAPFIKTGMIAASGGFVAILIGLIAFFRLSEPLITAIKELQERYEMAVRGSKDGLWDWPDISKDEEWWSDDWYGLLGLKRGDIESNYSGFKTLLHPDDLPRMEEALKSHFYGHEKYDVEFRLRHKSGEYRWLRSRGAVQRDKEGKALRMSGSISDIQEEKKNRETIEKLSQVSQQIPISVVITDHEGNIEFINEALTKLSGYSPDEVLGKTPRLFKSGESPDTYYKAMWETIAKGQEWRGVFHNKKKNGELYWESVLIFPLKDVNGKVSNFIGLKEDITEKKQLESTLIDHERLIRSVINNLKDGLIISSVDGNIQLFNHGAEKIFGYKAEEVMDKPVRILMDESYKERHDIGFARFKKTGKILHNHALMEVKAKAKDGTLIPIELSLTQMIQRGETLVVGMIHDISERKEAEAQRHRDKLRLELTLEGAELGAWDWNTQTNDVMFDDRLIGMLGYSQDEFEPKLSTWEKLVHQEDAQGLRIKLNSHLEGKTEIYEAEYRLQHKSGYWVWILDRGKVVEWDNEGKPLRACGTHLDISDRKEAEKKMENAQKQLIASQKLAGVGELAAGVSHEVLNPVNIISVLTQMLQRKTKDDSNIQNFCNKVKLEIDRIQKIMTSLLAFSRKGQVETEKGHMKDAIEATLALVENEYKLDNIKIVRDWCDMLVDISYDPDKIRQVYLNLVHNSKHAMPDGGTITVGCRSVKETSKNFHQFTFSDTGMGMSEEVRLKIFEPFFTTKPEGEGTGMGMAVIHGIIEEHGGKIRVESEEGKGTTFIISLPVG
jgi:PAS domain S-box-containing protein